VRREHGAPELLQLLWLPQVPPFSTHLCPPAAWGRARFVPAAGLGTCGAAVVEAWKPTFLDAQG